MQPCQVSLECRSCCGGRFTDPFGAAPVPAAAAGGKEGAMMVAWASPDAAGVGPGSPPPSEVRAPTALMPLHTQAAG
jgi:hypothetical protein